MRRPSDEISPKSAKTRRKRPLARPSGVGQNPQDETKSGLKVDLSQREIEDIFGGIAFGESENPALALNVIYEKALDAIAETVKGAFVSFAAGLSEKNISDVPFLAHALAGIDPEKVAGMAGSFLEKIDQSRDRLKLSLEAASQNALVQGGGRESVLRAAALSQDADNHVIPLFGERLSKPRLEEILQNIQKTKAVVKSSYTLDTSPNQSFKISFNDGALPPSSTKTKVEAASAVKKQPHQEDTKDPQPLLKSGSAKPSNIDSESLDSRVGSDLGLKECVPAYVLGLEDTELPSEASAPLNAGLSDEAFQNAGHKDLENEVQKASVKPLALPEASDLAMDLLATASQSLGESLPLEWLEIFASLGQGEDLEGFGSELKALAEGVAESMSAVALEFARVALEAEADIQKERHAQSQAEAQEARLHALKDDARVASDEELLAFLDFLEGNGGDDSAASDDAAKDSQVDTGTAKDDGDTLSNEDLAQAFALLLEQFET